ncbi:MAG: BlaI/MecI/CopY family transcriptional regulator [Oscillospiraceae bacterium]|nr:BlaI/MecI/CopY family transcriptional regulator [Oscillospiraceae bacterium]
MKELQMGEIETRFAEIIWQNEPIATNTLIRISEQELGWKRTTTYTVLKRLCEKGIFQMENSTVTSCISRNEFYARQSEQFVRETFGGSLPSFLSAFAERKKLTPEEIDAIRRFIDSFEEEPRS